MSLKHVPEIVVTTCHNFADPRDTFRDTLGTQWGTQSCPPNCVPVFFGGDTVVLTPGKDLRKAQWNDYRVPQKNPNMSLNVSMGLARLCPVVTTISRTLF